MIFDIKVEKGVPIPDRRGGCGPSKYPFDKMEPGDSFALDADGDKPHKVAWAAHVWGKKNGAKFSARTSGGKTRVWRVS